MRGNTITGSPKVFINNCGPEIDMIRLRTLYQLTGSKPVSYLQN